MNFLTENLPESVIVGGRTVPINTDFRAGIRLELWSLDDKLNAERLLTNYYGNRWPEPYDEAVKAAIWFYRCGKEPEKEDETKQKLNQKRRSYDFEFDAEAIYTSFQQAYQINLLADDLHWWEFRSLLVGLPDETPFMKRVYYRTGKTFGMNKHQKKAFEECRKRYALPERGAIDHRLTLIERNTEIKQYVERRFRESNKKG